jgi:hypothetical protein
MAELNKYIDMIGRQFKRQEAVKKTPLPDGIVPMVDIIPVGACDGSEIIHHTVGTDEVAVFNLKMAIHKEPEMILSPGRYVKLIVDGELMMTDAPYEARSNHDVLSRARGNVLIGGLGIGMKVKNDLDKTLRQLLHELKNSSIGHTAFASRDDDPNPYCVCIAVTKEQAKRLKRKVMSHD